MFITFYFLLCKNYAIVFYINNVVRLHLYEFVQLKVGKPFSVVDVKECLILHMPAKMSID